MVKDRFCKSNSYDRSFCGKIKKLFRIHVHKKNTAHYKYVNIIILNAVFFIPIPMKYDILIQNRTNNSGDEESGTKISRRSHDYS